MQEDSRLLSASLHAGGTHLGLGHAALAVLAPWTQTQPLSVGVVVDACAVMIEDPQGQEVLEARRSPAGGLCRQVLS